jgi:cell division protein FtsB/cell division protein DivIC
VTRKKRQGVISLPRLVAIVTFTLVAVLMVDFGRKALDNYQIQRQVEWLREQTEIEREAHDSLQEELEYVSSDAYVEEIARERLKLVQPGDTAVVVVPLVVADPPTANHSAAAATEGESVEPYWRQWADLLLGTE